jgi:Carboxyl transferase domain/Malonate decarboxylase gamma subunit (MdcE)
MLTEFRRIVQFQPQGEGVGNLSLGRGVVDRQPCYVAVIENRIASGAIGVVECDKLTSLFKVVAAQRAPLVLFIDSAGARVSEGLPALGAFRRMFAAAVKASASGAPMACVIGTNCFGGASMLATLCHTRYFNVHSRLAMSGPTILAAQAGVSAIDDAFRAIAEVSIGSSGRIKLASNHLAFTDAVTFTNASADTFLNAQHLLLGEQLAAAKLFAKGSTEPVKRKDLSALYPAGIEAQETNGVLTGQATYQGEATSIFGSIDRQPMTAGRAYALADLLWKMAVADAPKKLHVLVDCDAHSTSMDDEKVMLSRYLVDLAHALHALQRRGTIVETIVLGKLGGGIYVTLAAASQVMNIIYGAEIQLLPNKAITAILGNTDGVPTEFADYLKAGVADRELKIGIV